MRLTSFILMMGVDSYGLHLRARVDSGNAVLKDDSNKIHVPGLDSPDSPDQYSGIGYDGDGGDFSIDVGSAAVQFDATSTTPNPLVVGLNSPDYGMINPKYQPPSVSQSTVFNSWTPPKYILEGCSPSSNGGGGCPKAKMGQYNLGLGNLISATSMPSFRI